jgi:low temperature requirement protein LtrA
MARLLRPPALRPSGAGNRHASWLELFFDLCFVAAVAALAGGLHDAHSGAGLARFALLFIPIWWAWMSFTWYGTAFDTDDVAYRLTLLAAMLVVVVLAANTDVTGGRSAAFALAYTGLLALLVGLWLRAWRHDTVTRPLSIRYAAGNALGGGVWLASLLLEPPGRYVAWTIAMVVLMTTPVLAVRALEIPAFDPEHIPERYGLFTIIVLGESVVAVGAGASEVHGAAPLVGVFGFGIAAALWWLYFDFVRSSSLSRERLVAAFVWGYGHLLVFAGIAAASIGVEFAIEAAAEGEHLDLVGRSALAGGIVAFLAAVSVIHAITVGRADRVLAARLGAAGAVAVLWLAGGSLEAAAMTGLLLLVVAVAAAIEIGWAQAGRHPVAPPPDATDGGTS